MRKRSANTGWRPRFVREAVGRVRRAGARGRLTIRAESGVNDPMAVLLTVGTAVSPDRPHGGAWWLRFGAAQLLGGIVVEVLCGWAGVWLLRRLDLGAAADRTGGVAAVR